MMENKQLEKEALVTVEQINTLSVKDNDGNTLATKLLQGNKELQAKVHETFDPICDKAHKTWKEAVAQRDKFLKPLQDAERTVKSKISAFIMDQQRIAREAQDKLDAARRKEEEKQRAALEAKAVKAEEKGNIEKAEELREKKEGVFIPGAVVESTVEKVEGQTSRTTYDFEIIDETLIPRKYLIVDDKKIRQMVKTFGKEASIPGVRIYPKVVVSIRT
ncbi:MAG: hypothetical protein ABIF10_05535 [Candidatus Woesearchaeota archaeon]